MPTYDYHCSSCGEMEIEQKITEPRLEICPSCKSPTLTRGPGGGIGLSFKGSGFYKTDYASTPTAAPKEPLSTTSSCCPCGKNTSCKSS